MSYRNPQQLKGINFNSIDETMSEGLSNVGEAMSSIAKQKQEAYTKLEAKHAQYLEDTYLERAKGMDEAQHAAIQESVQMNIVDFSNLSGMEKANNLNSVKEIKQTQAALESIVTDVSDGDRILNKGLDKKYLDFFEDLSSMNTDNIKYIPNKNGLGFTIEHTNSRGEKNTFNQSQILTMSSMTGDVGETLDAIDDNISSVVDIISEERDAFAEAQQLDKWNEDEAFADTYQTFQKIGKEKMAVYFSEYVSPYEEIAPKTDGEGNPLSEDEMAKKYEENVDKTINHMINTAKEEVRRTAKKKPYFKPPAPPRQRSGGYTEDDYNAAEQFKMDVARMQSSGDPKYISKYLNNGNIEVEYDRKSNTLNFYKKRTKEVEKDGETVTQVETELVDSDVPMSDATAIYNTAKKYSVEQSFFNLLERRETQLTAAQLDRARLNPNPVKGEPVATEEEKSLINSFMNEGEIADNKQKVIDTFGEGVTFKFAYGKPISVKIDGRTYKFGNDVQADAEKAFMKLQEKMFQNRKAESSNTGGLPPIEEILPQ